MSGAGFRSLAFSQTPVYTAKPCTDTGLYSIAQCACLYVPAFAILIALIPIGGWTGWLSWPQWRASPKVTLLRWLHYW